MVMPSRRPHRQKPRTSGSFRASLLRKRGEVFVRADMPGFRTHRAAKLGMGPGRTHFGSVSDACWLAYLRAW